MFIYSFTSYMYLMIQAITVNEVQKDRQKTKDWATQNSLSKKLSFLTLYPTSNNKQCGYLEVLHEQIGRQSIGSFYEENWCLFTLDMVCIVTLISIPQYNLHLYDC
jgi:hypothetical protein